MSLFVSDINVNLLYSHSVDICCVSLFYTRTHLNQVPTRNRVQPMVRFPNIKKLVFDVYRRKILNNNVVCDFKQNDMFLVNPSELLCNDSNCGSLQMIFIVKSYVLNFGQREARTWGSMTKLRSKTVFIIGYLDDIDYLVNLESAKHNILFS